MRMLVVDVRKVRVAVLQRRMGVRMGMRLHAVPHKIMVVLVVPIVDVAMCMV